MTQLPLVFKPDVVIYTDGSYRYKSQVGGWACQFHHNGRIYEACGSYRDGSDHSSVFMEYFAIYKALKATPIGTKIHLKTDCLETTDLIKRVSKWSNGNTWAAWYCKHKDFITELCELVEERLVEFKWVKRDSESGNKRCNRLSYKCARFRELRDERSERDTFYPDIPVFLL